MDILTNIISTVLIALGISLIVHNWGAATGRLSPERKAEQKKHRLERLTKRHGRLSDRINKINGVETHYGKSAGRKAKTEKPAEPKAKAGRFEDASFVFSVIAIVAVFLILLFLIP